MGEIGLSPLYQYAFFDPLNLATDDNFALMREAELKHGRVAMFATFGMFFPDLFRDELVPHNLIISRSLNLEFDDIPSGIKAIPVVPWQGWLQILVFVGYLETRVF